LACGNPFAFFGSIEPQNQNPFQLQGKTRYRWNQKSYSKNQGFEVTLQGPMTKTQLKIQQRSKLIPLL